MKWVPGNPITIFFTTSFTWRMPHRSDAMYSSILMLENNFTWSRQNSQKIANFIEFDLDPRGLIFEIKSKLSCKFALIYVKLWCHMFSRMKMEECIESEVSSIFRVKLMVKNILFGPWGCNTELAASAVWCLFLKKHTNVVNQTVRV